MATYQVRVTATYAPTEQVPESERGEHRPGMEYRPPDELVDNLDEWASRAPDKTAGELAERGFKVDYMASPVRTTVTTIYEVEADSENDAERAAEEAFAAAQVEGGVSGPETVRAVAELL